MGADFAGGWQQVDSSNAENVMSQTGMVIMYANCPIYWRSSLQTEIALSAAKAEYISLSSALQEMLLLMTMMEEIKNYFFSSYKTPSLYAKSMKTISLVYKWLPGPKKRESKTLH